ncbi:MAG TPA: LysR family transcriptional regulator [Azospirillum sp.]|nr:LysR family transcriptional regulator [Azospirillum sp.]
MKLRQVELFLAVVDHGGFIAAAERLGIAQPAVSAAVRRLEEELGGPLLVRGGRGVVLTPEGDTEGV